jgi:hypothetical protein
MCEANSGIYTHHGDIHVYSQEEKLEESCVLFYNKYTDMLYLS